VAVTTAIVQTERDLQRAAIDLAHIFGWRVAHFRPAKTAKGWRTPVEADGKGFPDLLLVRGDQIKVRELKAGRNKPTADQSEWLAAFTAAGIDAAVWTAADIPDGIVEELRSKVTPC
jgi:hypothetical protein